MREDIWKKLYVETNPNKFKTMYDEIIRKTRQECEKESWFRGMYRPDKQVEKLRKELKKCEKDYAFTNDELIKVNENLNIQLDELEQERTRILEKIEKMRKRNCHGSQHRMVCNMESDSSMSRCHNCNIFYDVKKAIEEVEHG